MRIQKYLAQKDTISRRQVESWIQAGALQINQQVAQLGDRVSEGDIITYKTKRWSVKFNTYPVEILWYHKPLGELCTRKDCQQRPLIYDNLPQPENGKWIAIGRLDINSTGLLLFTNRGDWAAAMMHPRAQWLRCYRVRVYGALPADALDRLCDGIQLDGNLCRFAHISPVERAQEASRNHWYTVGVFTGRYRMIRRMFSTLDVQVNRLHRYAFGPITLPKSSKPGESGKIRPHLLLEWANAQGLAV